MHEITRYDSSVLGFSKNHKNTVQKYMSESKAVGTAEAGEVSASPLFCRSGRGFVCTSAYYHVAF